MASPGSVYHPEQEIELMTAALDDAVVLANGQRSSAVKVLSNYEYPHSWALPDDDCWPERTGVSFITNPGEAG